MEIIVEPEFLDPETGLLVEIVRDADTGEVVGKNERVPEETSE
jgi:hypothetical protein